MPNTDQPFRLNWATFSTGDKRSDNGPDLSIFVGDLAADVTDSLLHETFASRYPSVKAAKVVFDANTGRSKGYGFVRFGDDNERSQAMTEMNGVYCSSRPMRIGAATPRKSSGYQQQYSSQGNWFFFLQFSACWTGSRGFLTLLCFICPVTNLLYMLWGMVRPFPSYSYCLVGIVYAPIAMA